MVIGACCERVFGTVDVVLTEYFMHTEPSEVFNHRSCRPCPFELGGESAKGRLLLLVRCGLHQPEQHGGKGGSGGVNGAYLPAR